jgi:nuclear pore complex protein Nup188
LVELSLGLEVSGGFQTSIATTIRKCLTSNLETNMPEAIFSRLTQARASLAFALLQRLNITTENNNEAKSILKPTWDTLRDVAPDVGTALCGADADYVRTLLKVLYLALQAHTTASPPATTANGAARQDLNTVGTVLEILKQCAVSGFRSLVTLLHEDVSKVNPTDVALLNGILRSCLRVPDVENHTQALGTIFEDQQSALYASTLLSWSHKLTMDKDPVYAELSLGFLLEMSSVPALAEYVVTSGTLGRIASADVTGYLRRPGGTGPFDDPARVYSIWTRVMLPLSINLLTAIGAPIAGDVGTFINQFGPQLDRASVSMDSKRTVSILPGARASYITFAMASEAHSLALIASVLDMFREAGASAGLSSAEVPDIAWERSAIKSDLETRLQRPTQLRDDIIPSNDREEALSKQKASANTRFENRLEEMVVGEMSAALALLGDIET